MTKAIPELNEKELTQLLQIKPSVKMSVRIENKQNIIFQAIDDFKPNTIYNVKINSSLLIASHHTQDAVPEKLREFNLQFKTPPQYCEVRFLSNEFISDKNQNTQNTSFLISTPDFESNTFVEKSIKTNKKIIWEHRQSEKTHIATIVNELRDEQNKTQSFINQNPPHNNSKKINYTIWGTEFFTLNDYKLVSEESNCIELQFNETIKEKQVFEELIYANGRPITQFLVDKNIIKLYGIEFDENQNISIQIDSELLSSKAISLQKPFHITISKSKAAPQIAFLDDKSGILPSTERCEITFKAVALKAVDVTVVEIYDDNILDLFRETQQLLTVAQFVNLVGHYSKNNSAG